MTTERAAYEKFKAIRDLRKRQLADAETALIIAADALMAQILDVELPEMEAKYP